LGLRRKTTMMRGTRIMKIRVMMVNVDRVSG